MNIPLALTFTRLIISPIPAALLVFLLPSATIGMHVFLAALFIGMALTDFFDGYLARLWQQETVLGKILDPIADKMLVIAAIIVLVYLQKIFWLWAIIIVGREILITGLRELALENKFSLPVTQWGKYKSGLQYLYITLVIIGLSTGIVYITIEWAMIIATIASGYQYIRTFIQQYLIQ